MTLKTRIHWMNLALASTLALAIAGAGCGDDSKPAADAAVGDSSAGGAGGGGAGGAGGNAGSSGAGGGSAGAGGGGPGAGGSSGSGGAGGGAADAAGDMGAGGADGGSGSDAVASCSIPCLQNLLTQCPPEGACTESESGMAPVSSTTNSCYANGVKTQFSLALTGLAFRVFKPGGAACFSMEVGLADIQTGSASIKDGTGTVIATSTVNPQTMKQTITCTATGMTYDASMCEDVPSTDNMGMPEDMCTPGTCTIP